MTRFEKCETRSARVSMWGCQFEIEKKIKKKHLVERFGGDHQEG